MLRHIWLREFVALVGRELQMRPEEFADERFLRIAKLSLDRPAGRRQTPTGQRGREIQRSLPDKVVALVGSLLMHPPIPDYPGRVAMAAAEELVQRGHARMAVERAGAILRFDEWGRSARFDPGWVRDAVQSVRRQRTRGTEQLFGLPPLNIGLFLGGPLNDLRAAGQLAAVPELHHEMESVLRGLEAEQGDVRYTLFHPSFDVESQHHRDLWDYDLSLLEDQVSVLIVAEIGPHAIGFGAACELERFRGLPGEAAHLISRECTSRSNYVPGLSSELGIETLPYGDPGHIPARVASHLRSRHWHILDAARRRDDAVLLVEQTHRRLIAGFNHSCMTRTRRAQVLDDADISEARMARVLARPSAFAALSAYSQQRLLDRLDGLGGEGASDVHVDVDSLLVAAKARRWSAERIETLLHEGRARADGVTAAATRIAYLDPDSWTELNDALFGV